MQDDDPVGRILEQWRRERPDLDSSPKAVTGRIVRLAARFHEAYAGAFGPLGLRDGSYSVLAALRRAGKPFELSPGALGESLMLSSGGTSLLLDRLEGQGLIRRRPNPDDRRGVLVRLTAEGRSLADEAMAAQAEVDHHLVAGLTAVERDRLAALLAKLLRSVEG